MSLLRDRRQLAVVVATLLTVGCHRTVPVTTLPQPGARVTVTLTPLGSGELAAQLGPNVREAEGVVRTVRGDTVELALIRTALATGIDNLWQRQLVAFPRSAVAEVTERRLDRPRSWLAAGVIVGLAVLAAVRLSGGGQIGEVGPIVVPPN